MTSHDEEYIDALIEGLKALKSLAYCSYHKVATGAYDCPYADVVNNTICCNCKECNYNSITKKPVVNNENTNYDLSLNDEDIIDYPF